MGGVKRHHSPHIENALEKSPIEERVEKVLKPPVISPGQNYVMFGILELLLNKNQQK